MTVHCRGSLMRPPASSSDRVIIVLESIRTPDGSAGGDTGRRSSLVSRRQGSLRRTTSRTCLALALSLGTGLSLWPQAAAAQQITRGGGNGAGDRFGLGGIAGGGGGGGDRTIGFSGGDGGSAAQTPGGSATAGSAGTNDVGGGGGAGGAPGAPNDLSAGGGGGGGRGSYNSDSPATAERAEPGAAATSSRQPLRFPSARLMLVAQERPGPLAAPQLAVAAVAAAVAASS